MPARPDNDHAGLFWGFPNSYGTLGYALRCRVKLVPVAPFAVLQHATYSDPRTYFRDLADRCRRERLRPDGIAFIDGVFFGDEMIFTTGLFTADPPFDPSDYSFMRIYYRSLREREIDVLTTRNYIWRWDTDWFWCARAFGMEIPPVRFLFGVLGCLRSNTYWALRHWNERWRIVQRLGGMRSVEWVIQDVEVPVEHAVEFLEFLDRSIGIRPVWICPAQAYRPDAVYPLYRTDPGTLYINFGFWGGVKSSQPPGFYNRLVEREVARLNGKKSLYSTTWYSEDDFWEHYNRPAYIALKGRYDPENVFPDLYAKCVAG